MSDLELGVTTLTEIGLDASGGLLTHAQATRNIVEQGVAADTAGLDVFGIGEHHRADFAVTSPETVLATLAGRTSRIRLSSAVTVLSSDDPVRVFERFATLDALSSGRAEVMLGRGAYVESFPLFGYELADYERLFEEKLELFGLLLAEGPVTWSGTVRPALREQVVYPPTEGGLAAWIGVGGNPQSVLRAAQAGLPLVVATLGGPPAGLAPLVELYRRALAQLGRPPLPVALNAHGYVADTDAQARDELWPHYLASLEALARERQAPVLTRDQFDRATGPEGGLFVGSPDTVARKIVAATEVLGASRFAMKYSHGTLPHELMVRSIELLGREVAPRVRRLRERSAARA